MDEAAVREWRKAARTKLIAARVAIGEEQHTGYSRAIERNLRVVLDQLRFATISFCWPYQREFDARPLMFEYIERGVTCALPVVIGRGQPLTFRQWRPGVEMRSDVFGIPVPVNSPEVAPDAMLLPMVGFDDEGYRLGYGAGYFDITLAKFGGRTWSVGIGFEVGRVATIYPQPHDVPLDFTITERGAAAHSTKAKRTLPSICTAGRAREGNLR